MLSKRRIHLATLVLVLVIALSWRLHNVGFGFPSLYDPDEPIFMLKSLELLQNRTLNPRWFGHPGTTTIYLLAVMDVLVVGGSILFGRFDNVAAFIQAGYGNPGLLFGPARVMMTVIGTIAVGLTYVAGKRAHDARTGLMAAALLALNGLHIAWSQVVRTDIHASVFMLLSLIFAMRIVEEGRWRDYLLAGLFAGFAIATKWPAASVFAAVIGASAGRIFNRRGSLAQEAVRLPSAGLMLIAGMLIASPYLLLDWRTVVSDLTGEGRPFHLGHTGSGFLANLWWYLRFHVAGSMGWLGLGLAVAGTVITARRPGPARWTTLPAAAAFLVIISAQNLIWSRWVLPVLPMLCILAAVAVVAIIQKVQPLLSPAARPAVAALLVGTALIPSLIGARNQAVERSNDTRAQAAAWAVANIPPGSTLVLEHLELKLRTQPWRFLFPIGEGGCLDGLKLLEKKVGYDEVKQKRKGSNIVDLGNVAPNRIDSCRADYAILVYYDLYLLEAARFPMQIDVYRKVLAGGRTVALFRPKPGVAGGPTVRVFAIPRR